MKDEWTNEGEEIQLLPEINKLWLKLSGTLPYKRKYKTIYDNNNKNEVKCIGLIASIGANPYREKETLTFKNVTNNEGELVAFKNVLQYKEEINKLWKLLNTPIVHKQNRDCCICGVSMEQPYYLPSFGWTGLRVSNCTTCYGQGRYCSKIRERMVNHLRKLKRRINRLEKKTFCLKCNKEFHTPRKDSKFCSVKCRVANFRASNKGIEK